MGAAHIRAKKGRRRAAQGERATARFADSSDPGLPPVQGLYDPALDKDSCGVGFIADIKGRSSHKLIEDALAILSARNLVKPMKKTLATGRSRLWIDSRLERIGFLPGPETYDLVAALLCEQRIFSERAQGYRSSVDPN